MILFARKITPQLQAVLAEVPMPVLLLGQQLAGIHSIVHEDYQAGKTMAEYAVSAGHRRYLFVGVSENDYAVGVLRKKGFLMSWHKRPTSKSTLSKRPFQEEKRTKSPCVLERSIGNVHRMCYRQYCCCCIESRP